MKKIIILLITAAVLLTVYQLLSVNGYLETLKPQTIYEARDRLLEYVETRFLISAAVFVIVYFAAVAASVPGAALLTLTGGFLFGPVTGTLLVNAGASSGAFVIFVAARYFLGNHLQSRYGEKLAVFNREFEENGSSYLLMLRLIPVFPFFLINLLSGFTTVKTGTFLWTTVLGIIPGSFVYAYLGHAGTSLQPGKPLFTPQIILALCLLAALSMIPVIYRKIRKHKQGDNDG